jgi:hypothetical protein
MLGTNPWLRPLLGVRHSGGRYLPVLGPVWKYGDPVPPAARADRLEEKTPTIPRLVSCDSIPKR